MNRLIFLFLWVGGIAAVAQTVDFSNHKVFATPADRHVYNLDGTPLVGTSFVAQLYYGTAADSLAPVTSSPVTFRDPSSPTTPGLEGTWIGATRTLTGRSLGETVFLQVRVWDATGGLTYDQAVATGRLWGNSAAFTHYLWPIPTGDPTQFYMDNLRSFTLVPEPSLVVLAFLGAGTLFLLIRQRLN